MPSSHPALRPAAVARLKARLDAATAVTSPAAAASAVSSPQRGRNAGVVVSRLARRAAEPVLARVAGWVADDLARDTTALRSEVEQLADELARTRSALEAELALVRAELLSYRDPS